MMPIAMEQEGVVKFRLEHELSAAPCHPDFPALMRLRDELCAMGLIGVNAEGVGYGNVSLRANETRAENANSARSDGAVGMAGVPFVISGTGTGGRARLDVSGYCTVTACDVANNRVWCQGPVAASSESMTHWAVYAANAAMGCVAHVHNRRLFDVLLRQGVATTQRDIAYGTPAMAQAVHTCAAVMPEGGLVVMTGHDEGVLIFGTDAHAVRAALEPWLRP